MLNFNSERVLLLLDELKRIAEEHKYDAIITGVNDLIKKGDLAREPE